VCYLIVYYYELNTILTLPISGLNDKTIFDAYKIAFDELAAKDFKPKLNIMDNQATKYIKKFLTKEECKLQLVEPHNHRINAAELAIQTFKDAFLNMMRASCMDPSKSAYETLYGPYDWNQYPFAPVGCKAILYKNGNTRGLWASRGVNGWYLGPLMDHYHYNVYYILETCAYRNSGSTELFPQHCRLPDMYPHQHLCTLTNKLSKLSPPAKATPKGKRLLHLLQTCVHSLLKPPPVIQTEQRVDGPIDTHKAQQRVIDDAPIITIPRITEAPGIMKSRNLMAKCTLKTTPRLHQRVTRNNKPHIMPIPPVVQTMPQPAVVQTYHPILLGAPSHIVTRHAINAITESEIKNARTYLRHTFCPKLPLQRQQFDQSILHA
jgi:hypothetical protein